MNEEYQPPIPQEKTPNNDLPKVQDFEIVDKNNALYKVRTFSFSGNRIDKDNFQAPELVQYREGIIDVFQNAFTHYMGIKQEKFNEIMANFTPLPAPAA